MSTMAQALETGPQVGRAGVEAPASAPRNSAWRVLLASLIGTTIEFFDFYIFATAAVLVFPKLFFPGSDPTASTLSSLATFALAFFARPVGGVIFGHYGDRIGRKATLVAALMLMGLSTVFIGLLPTYAQVGLLAPLLLCVCRLGQGLGLGGEWGGAVLLATENAPPGRRTWYAMFPQLGAPIGFILSGSCFLALGGLAPEQFESWGWRVPFLLSSVMVVVGLWVRLRIMETPEFAAALSRQEHVKLPVGAILRTHKVDIVLGTCAAITTFVLFYLMTVYALTWATSPAGGYAKGDFLRMQLVAMLFFAAGVAISGWASDRFGRKRVLVATTVAIGAFGFAFAPMLSGGTGSAQAFLIAGLFLMGMTYGPIGAALSSMFPTHLRYTGASLTFNLGGIFGASLAPYIAVELARDVGLYAVGLYLTAAAAITLVAMLLSRRLND